MSDPNDRPAKGFELLAVSMCAPYRTASPPPPDPPPEPRWHWYWRLFLTARWAHRVGYPWRTIARAVLSTLRAGQAADIALSKENRR